MQHRSRSLSEAEYSGKHRYEPLMEDSPIERSGGHGGLLGMMDPGNPQNWPWRRKAFVSLVASAFAFTVTFGLTSYALAIPDIATEFNVSTTAAIVPFSTYLFGIAFTPIYTPHLTERYGRAPVYFVSLPLCALFIFAAGKAPSFAALVVTRFFAGFFGGSSLVLIEGTYADVWPPHLTVSYYGVLALASYLGAAFGPLVTGFIIPAHGWRSSQYSAVILALASFLLGVGMPETYPREIFRSRARRAGKPPSLPRAASGTTFGEMAKATIFTPMIMLVSEPIVILSTLYVTLLFGTIFQFFILIPPVMTATYSFSVQQVGKAFIAAIVGPIFAAAASIALDRLAYLRSITKGGYKDEIQVDMERLEYRLVPAMFGGVLMTASFFWIGLTAVPNTSFLSPILGTWMYVWGNMMILCSIIPYLFDAYLPAATLSALTAAACTRIIVAGILPLTVLQFANNVGGKGALSVFGFISLALMAVPFYLFRFGKDMRQRSKYNSRRSRQERQRNWHSMDTLRGSSVSNQEGPSRTRISKSVW